MAHDAGAFRLAVGVFPIHHMTFASETPPPRSPSRAGCPATVLAVPCGAGRGPAGSRQGGPAAGVGASGPALARPAPGGQRGACGPTPGVGTSGRRVAAGWHGVGGRGRWKRPFDFPIPHAVLLEFITCDEPHYSHRRGL